MDDPCNVVEAAALVDVNFASKRASAVGDGGLGGAARDGPKGVGGDDGLEDRLELKLKDCYADKAGAGGYAGHGALQAPEPAWRRWERTPVGAASVSPESDETEDGTDDE